MIAGTTMAVNSGNADSGTQRVVMASDVTTMPVKVQNAVTAVVSVSGTVTTQDKAVASANSAIPGFVLYAGGNDGTNIRAFKVDTAGVGAVTASVNNAISGVVSVSGTVTSSGTSTVKVSGILGANVATTTSAIPLFAGLVGFSDGTNLLPGIGISTAIVASANTQTRGVNAVLPLVQWVRTASAAANAKCTVTRTAITGAYNVIVGYSWSQGCGTASSTNDSVQVDHGPSGTAVVFSQHSARCAASNAQHYFANNLGWVASLFTAVGLTFSASAPASGFQFATIWGYTLPS